MDRLYSKFMLRHNKPILVYLAKKLAFPHKNYLILPPGKLNLYSLQFANYECFFFIFYKSLALVFEYTFGSSSWTNYWSHWHWRYYLYVSGMEINPVPNQSSLQLIMLHIYTCINIYIYVIGSGYTLPRSKKLTQTLPQLSFSHQI